MNVTSTTVSQIEVVDNEHDCQFEGCGILGTLLCSTFSVLLDTHLVLMNQPSSHLQQLNLNEIVDFVQIHMMEKHAPEYVSGEKCKRRAIL